MSWGRITIFLTQRADSVTVKATGLANIAQGSDRNETFG